MILLPEFEKEREQSHFFEGGRCIKFKKPTGRSLCFAVLKNMRVSCMYVCYVSQKGEMKKIPVIKKADKIL